MSNDIQYRTPDLPLAAFLHARGFQLRNVTHQRYRDKDQKEKTKATFWFGERRLVRTAILEYGNARDLNVHNVNAQQYIKSLDYLRSLAKNF